MWQKGKMRKHNKYLLGFLILSMFLISGCGKTASFTPQTSQQEKPFYDVSFEPSTITFNIDRSSTTDPGKYIMMNDFNFIKLKNTGNKRESFALCFDTESDYDMTFEFKKGRSVIGLEPNGEGYIYFRPAYYSPSATATRSLNDFMGTTNKIGYITFGESDGTYCEAKIKKPVNVQINIQ